MYQKYSQTHRAPDAAGGRVPTKVNPSMPTNTRHKTTADGSQVQSRYEDLGTDSKGREHVYRPPDDTIFIIAEDGSRERVTVPAGQRVNPHYMELVRDDCGWYDPRYGYLAYEPPGAEVLIGR